MKKEKLNLKSIKNVMSREEMKKIMAGSGPCRGPGYSCDNYYNFCCPGFSCNFGFNGGVCY